ncbi:acyl-CoA dehydrogenase family protein [Methylobacterium platani]|uniref:Acyl-CoA dehydrogenase n=2 Tax=Methylobacterium platani TaxID=427683 RepID=A0A179S0L2_9HYPH|nr:acyl-CoA dehydrogenase family protein [Methylobacterium platani]KMO15628.1 acyl-CoA dehydrogenase [Methylobacterium platani JCM 14648]OAS14207.1 acyl-CoA dehydrogenase [Methylobacterium platani]
MTIALRRPAPEATAGDPVAVARALVPVLAPLAASDDRGGRFAHASLAAIREAGLAGLTVPAARGGGGAGLTVAAAVIGTLAEADPAASLVLAMQFVQHASLARTGRVEGPDGIVARLQRAALREGALVNALRVEPALGSPSRGGLPETVARATPDGWRVSGRKIYSTGAPVLAAGLVWARTDEAEPRVGFVAVPMAAPGVRIEETWDHLGLRASGSHDVVLDDVAVPGDHALDLRPPAEWGGPDPVTTAWLTTLLGGLYDGVARAAQAWLCGHLVERRPANLGAPLASLPRIQEAVGENARRLAVNRRLLRGVAAETDAGEPPSASEGGLVKLTVTENAIAVVQDAVALVGNPGLSRRNPLERHLRDVLCARIHTPQGDAVRLAAGRAALGA